MQANVPPAPRLSNDSTLDVFVHHSAAAQGARLRILGEQLLKLAYMNALKDKRPSLGGNQLENYIDINYPVFVAYWVNAYGWKTNMWAVPEEVNLDDPVETRTIFETYAGAVVKDYRQPGDSPGEPSVLFAWIRDLLFISD